jgi:hypothetical protein
MPPSDSDQHHPDKRKRDTIDKVSFWIQVGTLYFVGTYTLITLGLYCQTKKVLNETRRANRVTASIARESAEATIAGVRAWVDIQDWYVPVATDINKGIALKIIDLGNTPAMNLQLREKYEFLPKGAAIPNFVGCPDVTSINIGSALEPSKPTIDQPPIGPFPPTTLITKDQMQAIAPDAARIILHGCIGYDTVATSPQTKNNVRGLTKFCSVFYGDPDRRKTTSCGFQME